MYDDAIRLARDITAILFFFALRIVVPFLIVLLIGAWLQRQLREPQTLPTPARPDVKGDLHCWEVQHCPETVRATCVAFQHPDLPCWLAMQLDGSALKEQCFTCPLFAPPPRRSIASAKT